MIARNVFRLICLALMTLCLTGCVRAARDTTGFSVTQADSLNAPFEDVWQAVKTVMRERELEIYTRDKRGTFVAFTPMKRRFFQPQRVQYTVEITPVNRFETKVHIEAVKQLYGVTMLTYPGWYDRPLKDAEAAGDLFSAVQTKLSSEAAADASGTTTTEAQ